MTKFLSSLVLCCVWLCYRFDLLHVLSVKLLTKIGSSRTFSNTSGGKTK